MSSPAAKEDLAAGLSSVLFEPGRSWARKMAKAVLRGITAAPWGKKKTCCAAAGQVKGGSDGDQTSMISHVQWLHMFLLFVLSFKWIKCAVSSLFNLSIGLEDLQNIPKLMNIHKFYELTFSWSSIPKNPEMNISQCNKWQLSARKISRYLQDSEHHPRVWHFLRLSAAFRHGGARFFFKSGLQAPSRWW